MLRYQLNPHFLFNTLNALSALVLEDKREQAEHVLLALSRFLRYSLEQDPAAKTPLKAEIAAQEEYLAIEQIRFGDKLRYVKSIEPNALDALVPCFILQPAVENSMKYAVAPSTRPVTVEINARVNGNQTILSVRDDGAHKKTATSGGLGVGLENVRRRLALIYGSAATMVAQQLANGGYEFEVRVPLERG
jgi:two-component system LytT family sensor kinase